MPSFQARLTAAILRTTGIVIRQYGGGPRFPKVLAAARAAPAAQPSAKARRRLGIRQSEFAGRTVWHFAPRDRAPSGHLLFYHGGGYVFAATVLHMRLYAALARQGIAVTAPMYPLAPEAGVEETTGFALDHYRRFTADHDGPFVIGGDSAGGGLAAATAMTARDAGLRLPDGMLLLCPWLDAAASHPDQPAIEPRDAILRIRGIRDAGLSYARGRAIDDPMVSPIHGDWSGLPPVLAFAGGDDILVTDARRLKAQQPSVEYHELAGMIHDWPIFGFPESRAAQAQMAAFIAAPGVHQAPGTLTTRPTPASGALA